MRVSSSLDSSIVVWISLLTLYGAAAFAARQIRQGSPRLIRCGLLVIQSSDIPDALLLVGHDAVVETRVSGGDSLDGAPGSASVTVPGYVAPDSNTVAPDERAVIRQYFSPSTPG